MTSAPPILEIGRTGPRALRFMASSRGFYIPLSHRPDLPLSEASAIDGGNELHHWLPWTRKFCLSDMLSSMLTGTLLATIIFQAIFIMHLRAGLQSKTLSPSMLPAEPVMDAELTFSSRRSRSDTRF